MGKRNVKGAKGPTPHLRSRTTRSSRGRLVTSTDSNPNEQLSAQLSLLGLYAAQTIGDGNCLFRALADQVHGSAVLHADVRKNTCDWIEAHGERYEGFVEDEGEESDAGGRGKRRGKGGKDKEGGKGKESSAQGGPSKRLQAYLRGMRENATYGGHMELSAFAHMTRRNIKVIQPGLVYVIEWRAGGSSPSSSSSSSAAIGASASTSNSADTTSSNAHSDATPSTPARRRSTRTPSVGGVTPRKKAKHEDKDVEKIRTGHGYYVYEEVTSDEEEDEGPSEEVKEEKEVAELVVGGAQEAEADAGPTIYVAYHDWEHFSSIRNLRGPHTGLPNIQETQPQTEDLPSQAEVEKEALKEREREKKRERERKDKERKERKERSALKVKLKVPSVTPEASDAAPVPHPAIQDPLSIPLPASRSASPFPVAQSSATAGPALLSTPAKHPLSTSMSSSSSAEPAPVHLRSHSRQPHLQAAATPGARAQYRSPKRTFDESSASGEDPDGREGREKRSRTRGASTGCAEGDDDPTILPAAGEDMDVDVGGEAVADPPPQSAPASTSSSSETNSEVASEVSSSTSPSPAPEPVAVAAVTPKKAVRYQHQHLVHGEKTLTRRQRKALGLPKQRSLAPTLVGVSAGKIVIPGGRWTGRPLSAAAAGGTESEADEEWRRNGNGRLDVRGFRELKI